MTTSTPGSPRHFVAKADDRDTVEQALRQISRFVTGYMANPGVVAQLLLACNAQQTVADLQGFEPRLLAELIDNCVKQFAQGGASGIRHIRFDDVIMAAPALRFLVKLINYVGEGVPAEMRVNARVVEAAERLYHDKVVDLTPAGA